VGQIPPIDEVALGAAQMRESRLAGSEDADQIQAEQVAKFVYREFVDRFVRRMPAGIINQAIEPAITRDRFLDQTRYLLDPGNIASDKLRFSGTTCIDFHRQ